MEDQPPNNELGVDNEADKARPKDSFLNFLRQLNRPEQAQRQSLELDDDSEESDDFDTSKELSLSPTRRFLRRFRASFKKWVSPPASPELAPAAAPASFMEAESAPPPSDEPQGELIIEHDPEPEAELATPVAEAEPELPESAPKTIETAQPDSAGERIVAGYRQNRPEHIGQVVRRLERQVPNLTAAEKRLRRRQRRAKKDTRELKGQAKSLAKEQSELRQRQQAFEKHLDTTLQKTKHPTAESLTPPVIKEKVIEPTGAAATSPERPPAPAPDLHQLDQLAETGPHERPEVVMERVEVAAAHDLPIETLYERRHETKNFGHTPTTAGGRGLTAQEIKQLQRPAAAQQRAIQAKLRRLEQVVKAPLAAGSAAPPLYKQAVASGFITALVLLAILAVILVA